MNFPNSLRTAPALAGLCALLLILGGAATQAAGTLLYDNLRAFGTRLSAGNPLVAATNQVGVAVDGPKDIGVADLDGDGRPDLAVANKDGAVTVYLGTGSGTFGAATYLHTGGRELRGVVLADLTGDGRRDVATGSPYEGNVYLFVNQGGGVFAPAVALPAWIGARDLAAGDFDGDGLVDLAVAGTTNGVAHWRSLGGGSFQVMTNVTELGSTNDVDFPQPAYYLRAFRMPGATRDELVAARAQLSKVYVLAADATGCLAIQGTLNNVGVNALDVGPLLRPASNGVPDLIVAHNDRGVLEIHSAVSTIARFTQLTNQQFSIPGGPRNVRIVDLDGDGWNDLVVVQQTFNKVTTFRNFNGVFVPTSEAPVGSLPREMDLGDFNGDGYPDAAVLNRYSSDVSILLTHPGVVGFTVLDNVYPVDGEVSGLEVRDFNGDGRADVIQIHRASGEISVRLAVTNGVLEAPTYIQTGPRPMGKVIADVNGDGRRDLVTADFTPFITVRLGQPGGQFGLPMNYGLPDPIPTSGLMPGMMLPSAQLFSLEVADFDGDGNPDVAVGFWDCRLGFYRGHGDGTFTFTRSHMLFREPRGQVSGDFDGDGDMDFGVVSLYGEMAIIQNPAHLLLTVTNLTREIIDTQIYNASGILAFDSDGDADPDLLVVGAIGSVLYVGGPGMTFTRSTHTPVPPGAVSSVVVADFDGDGDTDLAASCAQLSCVTVSLRDAAGNFAAYLKADVPSARYLAAGDLDGDGLPDLVGTGESLWVALSGRAARSVPPPPLPGPRNAANRLVINEVMAINSGYALDADGGRNSDWLEVYNGTTAPIPLAGWRLSLVRTNVTGIPVTNQFGFTNSFTPTNWVVVTNEYLFPNDAPLPLGRHQLVVCTSSIRSAYHAGFSLPGAGGTLCLFDPQGVEVDRLDYDQQQGNISHSRFRDGMASFIACNFPTPGRANTDSGPVAPRVDFGGVDLDTVRPGTPIRLFASATDDVAVMGVVVYWRRLDIPDTNIHRIVLSDDGMSQDGRMLDGLFSGVLPGGLPAGAEIQFYLECMDISQQLATSPGNPVFAAPGQPVTMHSLAVGASSPALEISEIVANNSNGIRDESGGTPDWIEIRNCGNSPVSLHGLWLSQSFHSDLSRYSLSNVLVLLPGQHQVIYADARPEQGNLHAPFTLNQAGDQVLLLGVTPNGARQLIDRVVFGPQRTDRAWARLGCAGPWREIQPTPHSQNLQLPWAGLVQGDSFTFGFPTTTGNTYLVEESDSIVPPAWTMRPPVVGTGVEATITRPMVQQRIYRVQIQ